MLFPGDHTPARKALLQTTKENLKYFLGNFENIMSSSSNDEGHTKLIEMTMNTNPKLPPVVSVKS